jgi:hypothetical protein
MVAYVCRYGHVGLGAALASDRHWLQVLGEELASIVEEENRPRGAGG